MEKEPFNDLLANVTSLTVDEANQLVVLANTYPYSQVIRNLAARAAQDNGLKSKEKLLQNSAIYSTDRSALKALMTAPTRARVEVKNIRAVEDVPTATTDIKPVEYKPDEQLHERLMADLAAMHESKKAFEDMIEKIESKKATPLADVAKKKEKTESKPAPTATPGDLIEEIKTTKKK